jgi:hypothetical protein
MMVSSIKAARLLVKLGAVFIGSMFVEYIAFRTFFSLIAFALVVLPIFMIKCQNCRTPIYDQRIAPHVKGFDLLALEQCPVCGDPMLPKEKRLL